MPRPPLETAYLHECFTYDPETGVLTWKERPLHHFKNPLAQHNWNLKKAGRPAGWPHWKRYVLVTLRPHTLSVHRVIWAMQTGEWPMHIDHANHNRADNRWINLRDCTIRQNTWNRARPERDLPRGVTLVRGHRFRALAKIRQKQIHLGYFDTPEEAHAAWRAFVEAGRGEFFRAD